jgi:single-strand DNA-binding protein
MQAFTVIAVGNLARNPETSSKDGKTHTRFCLVGNDYAGRGEDGEAREVVTSLWFVAFNGLAEAIANNARKGDQLIVQARIRDNTWVDTKGATLYDHSFIVESFRFGAPGQLSRGRLQRRQDEQEGQEA